MADDKALFTHHLEMANHHIQQLKEMHGIHEEGSADDGEEGQGIPYKEGDVKAEPKEFGKFKATPFAGKETAAEESAEDHVMAKKGRRR